MLLWVNGNGSKWLTVYSVVYFYGLKLKIGFIENIEYIGNSIYNSDIKDFGFEVFAKDSFVLSIVPKHIKFPLNSKISRVSQL